MDKIIVEDLLVRGILGVNPDERVQKQNILINLTLYVDTRPAAASDVLADAVNYDELTRRVQAHVEQAADFLVEKLTADVARLILAAYAPVQKVTVRVEKPDALRFARSVGVEITRSRADFDLEG